MDGWQEYKWGDLVTLEYGKSLVDYKEGNGAFPVFGTNGPIGFTGKPLCNFPSVIIGRKGAYRGVHF
jgi:type I restriction enzyme S subunit